MAPPRRPAWRRLTSSVAVRMAIVVFVALGAAAAVLAQQYQRQLQQTTHREQVAEARAIASTFAQQVSRRALEDPSAAQQAIDDLRSVHPDIIDAAIYRRNVALSVRLASTDRSMLDDPIDSGDITPLRTGSAVIKRLHDRGRPATRIAWPVTMRGEHQPAAVVTISFDRAASQRALQQVSHRVVAWSLTMALGLALLVAMLLQVLVFRPITKIGNAAWRIGDGQHGVRVGWRRRDELGELARAFDSMAIQLDDTHMQLRATATSDSLTGLRNHRALFQALVDELDRARTTGQPVATVVLDIDHFAEVNDRLGHTAGDELLLHFVRLLGSKLRQFDVAGRIGSDEFVLVLPGLDADGATAMIEELYEVVAEHAGPHVETLPINFSAGVSIYPDHGETAHELIVHADGAMYWSKCRGANRCTVFDPATDDATSASEEAERLRRSTLVKTVHALARAVDAKDGYTHMHSQRVASYGVTIATAMGLSENTIEVVRTAGVLHDVGKIGIPDSVLLKPGKLTDDEFDVMKRHSELGREIILGAGMDDVAWVVCCLHEHYDGRGYPAQLAGEEIPLESRILNVVDALEAMTSDRVYRPGMELAEAMRRLEQGIGTQFDPFVTRRVLAMLESGEFELLGERVELEGIDADSGELEPPAAAA